MTGYKKWQIGSIVVFIPAFLIFIVSLAVVCLMLFTVKASAGLGDSPSGDSSSMFLVTGASLITSFITSAISLLSLASSSFLSWKKEKRDRESFDIDNERKKLENEKMRYEIEELKKAHSSRKTKTK